MKYRSFQMFVCLSFVLLCLLNILVHPAAAPDVASILDQLQIDFLQLRSLEGRFPLKSAYELVHEMQVKCTEADQSYRQRPNQPQEKLVLIHVIMKMAAVIIDDRLLYDLHDQIILGYLRTPLDVDSYLRMQTQTLDGERLHEIHEKYRRQYFGGDIRRYKINIDRSPSLVSLRNVKFQVAGSESSASIAARKFSESLTLQFQDSIVANAHIRFFLQDAEDLGIAIEPYDYFDVSQSPPRKQEWVRRKAAEFLGRRFIELGCGVPPGPCYVPAGKYSVYEGNSIPRPEAKMIVTDQPQTDVEGYIWKLNPGGYADVSEIRTAREPIFQVFQPEFKLLRFDVGSNFETNRLEGTAEFRTFHRFNRNFALQTQLEGAFRSHHDNDDLARALAEGGFVPRENRPFEDFSSFEFQFDIGPVVRVGDVQLAAMHSLRWIDRDGWDEPGSVGHFFFNVGYIFKHGQVGGYAALASKDEPVVRSVQFDQVLFEETFLKVVDQFGVNFNVGIGEKASVEGAFGYLDSPIRDSVPGGVVRVNLPPMGSRNIKITAEFGYNESFVARDDSWRFGVGVRFGEWGKDNTPRTFRANDGPVPVYVPRVRYETLTRIVRRGNRRPVADAGPDQLDLIPFEIDGDGNRSRRVTLDGTDSFDPDGDDLIFRWALQEDCPRTVQLDDANSPTPTFVIGNGERCTIELVVVDSSGLESQPDDVTVSTVRVDAPVIEFFNANPSEIRRGGSSTLSWRALNAETITIANVPNVSEVEAEDSLSVTPNQTTTYVLTACNIVNECASAEATVLVRGPVPVILSFTADPAELREGQDQLRTTLRWEVQNAAFIEISGVGRLEGGANLPVGSVAVDVPRTTTFTLTASNDSGEFVSAEATVTVRPPLPEILSFTADPAEIREGSDPLRTTLRWDVRNADFIDISGVGRFAGSGNLPMGSVAVDVAQTTTFTLTASNAQGESVTAQTTVTVRPAVPTILTFAANPAEIREGQDPLQTTLSWNVENAAFIEISGVGRFEGSENLPVGSTTVDVNQTTTFVLSASNDRGEFVTAEATVTVRPPIPVIVSFAANPGEIRRGECSELTWEVENATEIQIDNLDQLCPGESGQLDGSVRVAPQETTTYTLTATNDQGEFVSAQVTVLVRPAIPVVLSFIANPPEIRAGDCSTLSWQVENAESIEIDNLVLCPGTVPPTTLPLTGSIRVQPPVTTTYTLTATNDRGEFVTAQATVLVTPDLPEIVFFTATPPEIRMGADPPQSSRLAWEVRGVDSVTITNLPGNPTLAPVGEVDVTPEQTTTYTLVASNSRGTVTAQVTVTVLPPLATPLIVNFEATPPAITAGGSSTLSWTTENTAFVRIQFDGQTTPRLAPNGTLTVSPTQTTTYTLRAFNSLGFTGDTAVVTVVVNP